MYEKTKQMSSSLTLTHFLPSRNYMIDNCILWTQNQTKIEAKSLRLFFSCLAKTFGNANVLLFNQRDNEMRYQSPRTQLTSPTKILNKGSERKRVVIMTQLSMIFFLISLSFSSAFKNKVGAASQKE